MEIDPPSPSPPPPPFTPPRLDPSALSAQKLPTSVMRRGPMYSAYAELRESRLRRKHEEEEDSAVADMRQLLTQTPKRKPTTTPIACRSVPNFAAALRKENRKPAATASPSPLPPKSKAPTLSSMMKTPQPHLAPKVVARGAGSASVGRGWEKRRGGGGGAMMVRSSYSCLRELKGFSDVAAVSEEEGGNRRRSSKVGVRKSIADVRSYI